MTVTGWLKKLDSLSIVVFISLIFSSNFFLLNIGESDRTLPYNAAIISSAIVIIAIALSKINKSRLIIVPSFAKHAVFILLLMVFPLTFMQSDIVAFLPRLMMLVGVVFIFLSLFQIGSSRPIQLVWVIAIIGAVQVVWGGYQFLIEEQARPYGIFQQVNVYGSFMATIFAISGFLSTRDNNGYKAIFLSLLSFFSFYFVYLTGSRTAILSALGVILLLLPILIHNFSKKSVRLWVGFLVIGLGVIAYSTFSASGMAESNQTIENAVPQAQEFLAKSGREYIYPQVIKLALENFWIGVGFENFDFEYLHKTSEWYHNGEFYTYGLYNLDYPHSEVLYWFVEGGVVSLVALLGLIFLILNLVNNCPKGWRLAFLALIMPIGLHTLLEYPLYHSQIHLMLLLLLLYVISRYSREHKQYISVKFNSKIIRALQVFLIGFSGVYLSSIYYANYLMKEFSFQKIRTPNSYPFYMKIGCWVIAMKGTIKQSSLPMQ